MKHSVKRPKNFKKLYAELSQWMQGNDYDGSLEYAFNNDFQLHAVSLWSSSGASKYSFDAGIDRKAESAEVDELLASADVFECPDCNHHAFYVKGELDEPPQCMGCLGNNMFKHGSSK